jgi:hypothetical protein
VGQTRKSGDAIATSALLLEADSKCSFLRIYSSAYSGVTPDQRAQPGRVSGLVCGLGGNGEIPPWVHGPVALGDVAGSNGGGVIPIDRGGGDNDRNRSSSASYSECG